jgi:hypothetical protein
MLPKEMKLLVFVVEEGSLTLGQFPEMVVAFSL